MCLYPCVAVICTSWRLWFAHRCSGYFCGLYWSYTSGEKLAFNLVSFHASMCVLSSSVLSVALFSNAFSPAVLIFICADLCTDVSSMFWEFGCMC